MTEQNGQRVRVQVTAPIDISIDEGPYAGLWLKCARETSNDAYFDFTAPEPEDDAEALQKVKRTQLARFGKEVLLGWNLDDKDGNPVQPTAEGMLSIPEALGMTFMLLWLNKLTEVPAPLGDGSSAGKPTPAASIPMVALSGSPAS